ncbi:MAG: polysulfide reductase NrfD [Desulfovibrio sp.]|jgi:molybdopterin-containing oxidoreductase family membrane subunit|nr:polysulfide reductase NrfD [Desulfovibrio sp.]
MAARRLPFSRFSLWLLFLGCLSLPGAYFYLEQYRQGICLTGLSRDVPWGLYVAQFTFLVGVAASSVVFTLPAHFHQDQRFARLLLPAESLAIGAVFSACLFVFVDLGRPERLWNILLHPHPGSLIFWDMIALPGYLVLTSLLFWLRWNRQRHGIPPPPRTGGLLTLSIFWAFSIHTLTAFLYAGLPGRDFWFSAILAARFLASAFCSGPAILLLLALAGQRFFRLSPDPQALRALLRIITYTMGLTIFFFLLACFSVFYGQIPAQTASFAMLASSSSLPAWCLGTALVSFSLLACPAARAHPVLLPLSLVLVLVSIWLDKGYLFILGGFSRNPFGQAAFYAPSLPEACIALSIYACGALVVSIGLRLGSAEESGLRPEPGRGAASPGRERKGAAGEKFR